MEKKYFLVIIGIIIIIGFGLFFINNNQINLDGTSFEKIEGYNAVSGDNFINFTKNDKFIFIQTSNDTINKSINDYLKSKNNASYELTDFSLNGLKVYKVTIDNYTIGHFWFEKNHKVYEIYTWNYDEPTNVDIMNLIKSAS